MINEKKRLTFGELETLAGALLTVLLPLMFTSVAREETELLQFRTQFGVKFDKGTGNPETRGTGLAGYSAAVGENHNIETLRELHRQQRLPNVGAGRLICKIIIERPVIDRNLALSRS